MPSRLARLTLAAAAVALLYAAWLPHRPFSDEGSVCTLAQAMLDGKVLYRDVSNEKAPGQYALAAVFFAALGEDLAVLRLAPALALLACTLLAARLAAALSRSRHAGDVAAAAVLLAAPAYQAFNAVAETTLAAVTLAAASLLLAPPAALRASRWRFALVGAVLGVGLWFKQTYLLGLAGFLAAPELRGHRRAVLAGAAVSWVAGLVATCLHAGPAFLAATVEGVLGAASPERGYARLPTPIDGAVLAAHVAVLALVASRGGSTRQRGAIDLAIVAAALSLAALPRVDAFRAWPAAAALGVAATVAALSHPRPAGRRLAGGAVLAWAALCSVARPPWAAGDFRELRGIAGAVAALAGEGETIWVGPFEPNIYCLSARAPASRHTFALPWQPRDSGRKELLDDLRSAPPRVIVDVSARDGRTAGLEAAVPGISRLLADRYRLAGTEHGAAVWVREPPAAAKRPGADHPQGWRPAASGEGAPPS